MVVLMAAAWCSEEEIQAERDLLETYRERLREADITINNLNAKLAARPSLTSIHRHQNGTNTRVVCVLIEWCQVLNKMPGLRVLYSIGICDSTSVQ